MARRRRDISFAAGLALIVVAIWLALVPPRRAEETRAPAQEPAAAVEAEQGLPETPPAEVPVVEAAPPEPPAPPREARREESLEGKTAFHRRLIAGSRLRRLRAEMDRSGADLPGIKDDVVPHLVPGALLRADGRDWVRPFSRGLLERDHLAELLDELTRPRRDLESLRLTHRGGAGDPRGGEGWVRVWSLDRGLPVAEIRAAEEVLDRICEVIGAGFEEGFDVLATPRRGLEVFPALATRPWAAGVYYRRDGFCTVKSLLRPAFRQEVLKHELIHALTDRVVEGLTSRLICEGLAEYLRVLTPVDQGLKARPERLADNLALLQAWIDHLRARGVGIDRLRPRFLLDLPPERFYALRAFGYLLAQATMACIGHRPIEAAFAARSDEPIREAVYELQWDEFLSFVTRHAAKGSTGRAIVVEDAPPDEERVLWDRERSPQAFRSSLEELDIRLAPGTAIDPGSTVFLPERAIEDDLVTKAIWSLVRAAAGSAADGARHPHPLILQDAASAPGPFSAGLKSLERPPYPIKDALGATDRMGFVKRVHEALPGSEHFRFESIAPSREMTFAGSIAASKPRAHDFIICLASRDLAARSALEAAAGGRAMVEENMREELKEHYRRAFEDARIEVRTALIIDLSKGEGDAFPLAWALAAAQGFQAMVVYWDPQADPPPPVPGVDDGN